MTDKRELPPERKALLDAAVTDGWPIRQIIATYGIGFAAIKHHHPDYKGMNCVDSGKLSMAIQRLNHFIEAQK